LSNELSSGTFKSDPPWTALLFRHQLVALEVVRFSVLSTKTLRSTKTLMIVIFSTKPLMIVIFSTKALMIVILRTKALMIVILIVIRHLCAI
jgi:hypothetical protein